MQIGHGVPLVYQTSFAPDIGVDRDELLEYFVERCHSFGLDDPDTACPKILLSLSHIITDPHFIRTVIPETRGRHIVYEQIGGLTVLSHYHPNDVASRPHNHGRTWAIYGVATGKTAMYEWDLVESGKVKLAKSYWMMPGQVSYFPIGAIHSHCTYDNSRLIRVEGMNIKRRSLEIGGRYFEPVEV